MATFGRDMDEYRKMLEQGAIQRAYKGLMEYMLGLRAFFQHKYPDYVVSGSLYYGYMDMTYFSFFPPSLKARNLKVAVVFLHQAFRFEAWLAGYNKQVQAAAWKMFKESGWDRYPLTPTLKGADSIIECVLSADPDFGDLDGLTARIEHGTLQFIQDVEGFLAAG